MRLRFVIGDSGAGKTSFLVGEIQRALGQAGPKVYLVPEQFSLQSEKLLLGGREAVTDAQVLSFNRLAYRLFSILGGAPGKVVGEIGRQLLLRKVVGELGGQLSFFRSAADKPGFLAELAATVSAMAENGVTPAQLLDAAQQFDLGGVLAPKLLDVALIAGRYRDCVRDSYLVGDEMPEILCEKLDAHGDRPIPLLDGAHFWLDGFSGFTSWESRVVGHIVKRAECVTAAFTVNDGIAGGQRETMRKLAAFVGGEQCAEIVTLPGSLRHGEGSPLRGLAGLFSGTPAGPGPEEGALLIVEARDPYAECLEAARQVLDMTRGGECRFGDIAIVCDNRGEYEKPLAAVFSRLKIPLFVDSEAPLGGHPLVEHVLSALDIALYGRRYEDVFRHLKTGLGPLPAGSVDILENYALAYGIASYKWDRPFAAKGARNLRAAEEARLAFLSSMRRLWGLAGRRDTVRNFSLKVFEFLSDNMVPERLGALANESFLDGRPAEARRHGQAWPGLCDVFDKYVEILGDWTVDLAAYAQSLKAGIDKATLGRIPPTTDQVTLGDTSRSRYPDIKAMLVLGANDGHFPPPVAEGGLFTERERETLANCQIETGKAALAKSSEQLYNIYCALTKPSRRLVLLHSKFGPTGKPRRPAQLAALLAKNCGMPVARAAPECTEFAPKSARSPLYNLGRAAEALLLENTFHSSVSRLESYALCPYMYFLRYMLGARPRKRYEVLPGDLGSHFHDALAGFTQILNGGLPEEGDVARIAKSLVERALEGSDLLDGTGRNRHIAALLQKATAASCAAILEQRRRADFAPELTEEDAVLALELESGALLKVFGRIDRIDALELESDAGGSPGAGKVTYLNVIDYKSGRISLSESEMRQGVKLQLALYLLAAVEKRLAAGGSAKPGGAFYFPIQDPLVPSDKELDDETRKEALLRCFRLTGVVSARVAANVDRTLAPGAASSVLPVALNQDGGIKKTPAKTVLEEGEMKQLLEDAKGVAAGIASDILAGKFAPNPYVTKKSNPCRFCDYGPACMKDDGL